MTACFFIPSIAPSILAASKGLGILPSSPSLDFGFGLRYSPDESALVNVLERDW